MSIELVFYSILFVRERYFPSLSLSMKRNNASVAIKKEARAM